MTSVGSGSHGSGGPCSDALDAQLQKKCEEKYRDIKKMCVLAVSYELKNRGVKRVGRTDDHKANEALKAKPDSKTAPRAVKQPKAKAK
ncbi:unnamed protein product, partial [Symbiodinium sp. KB8]